jgi:hypothetical protein
MRKQPNLLASARLTAETNAALMARLNEEPPLRCVLDETRRIVDLIEIERHHERQFVSSNIALRGPFTAGAVGNRPDTSAASAQLRGARGARATPLFADGLTWRLCRPTEREGYPFHGLAMAGRDSGE